MDIGLYRKEVQDLVKQIQGSRGVSAAETIACCNKLEQYGQKIKDDALIGFARFSRGEACYMQNDMINFYREMIACLSPLERISEWGYVAMANNMLGIMSLNRGNPPFAMDYYLKALAICQKYHLPDLEWIERMNIGTLYLQIEDYPNAIANFTEGYRYIKSRPTMNGFVGTLTAVYVGMGKAYIQMNDPNKAQTFVERLDAECIPNLVEVDKLVAYCFEARYYNQIHEEQKRDAYIQKVTEHLTEKIPLMDVFDDFDSYLKMLLEIQKYEDFFRTLEVIEKTAEKTNVKNLMLSVLILRLSYYKKAGKTEEYKEAAVRYVKLSREMEHESRIMVNSMISLRNSLNNLTIINKEVEKENRILQKKSETDALTGLYNRHKLNVYTDEAFERAYQNKTSLAFEILDVDFFKEYNDHYGHPEGDKCIRLIAQMVQSLQEHGNIFCARYGGDEFVVIYEGYTEEKVMEFAKELQEKIRVRAIEHKYSKTSDLISISQGICYGIPTDYVMVWEYLHQADEMLYRVKETEKGGIRLGHYAKGNE